MLVRKPNFKASKVMAHKVENTPNIKVMFNVEVKEVLGDEEKVNGASIFNNLTREESSLDITGFFVAIGHHPNTEIFNSWLEMDGVGYIKTENCSTKTNIPGIFCCGDAQDPIYHQAVTAAGSGCMAAIDCERFLSTMEHDLVQ